MRNLIFTLSVIGFLISISTTLIAGEIYRWIDKNGNVFFSDSPPPYGSFKKQNIEDEIDKSIERKKDVEKRPDVDEGEKVDQKIKLEIEYQKRAKGIRDYQMMRDELDTLKEEYQKKHDELRRQWSRNFPGSSTRSDINKEAERFKREYENKAKEIRRYYGYF